MSVHHPATAWRAGRIDDTKAWYFRLPPSAVEALAPLLTEPLEPLTAARLPDEARRRLRAELRPVAEELERGRGFVIVEPVAGVQDDRRRTLLYWLVGLALGEPAEQNVQGTLLYDVRDTGQDVRYGARFSVTNAESSFHTDASFWPDVVDVVGLLCLRPARSGGVNHLVNGHAVRDELAARDPEALAALARRYHVDRRGGSRPGEPATTEAPILEERPDGLLFRYLRYWIEAGQEKVGRPLSEAQKRPLDSLDRTLADPSLRVELSLRAGEMLFLNNRWLLHNRTAFEDHSEPERRRHLVRLWLRT
jgi:alpha-ketoglutarate-dependent taurine dioxygenase